MEPLYNAGHIGPFGTVILFPRGDYVDGRDGETYNYDAIYEEQNRHNGLFTNDGELYALLVPQINDIVYMVSIHYNIQVIDIMTTQSELLAMENMAIARRVLKRTMHNFIGKQRRTRRAQMEAFSESKRGSLLPDEIKNQIGLFSFAKSGGGRGTKKRKKQKKQKKQKK